MKQHYEILCIFSVKFDEQALASAMKQVWEYFTKEGGTISIQENQGNQKLAYPIRHESSGVYVRAELDLETSQLAKVEHNLKLMPALLRYLIVKKKIKTAADLAEEKMVREKIAEKKMVTLEKEKQAEFKETAAKEAAVKEKVKPREKENKISLEDLDKKLDEILKEEI